MFYVCMYVCIYACMYVFMYVCISYVCMYLCMYVGMYLFMYVCMYVYTFFHPSELSTLVCMYVSLWTIQAILLNSDMCNPDFRLNRTNLEVPVPSYTYNSYTHNPDLPYPERNLGSTSVRIK